MSVYNKVERDSVINVKNEMKIEEDILSAVTMKTEIKKEDDVFSSKCVQLVQSDM
jgi:ribosomal protein S6